MIRKLAPLLVTLGIAAPASVALADERYVIPNDTTVVDVRYDNDGSRYDRRDRRDRHDWNDGRYRQDRRGRYWQPRVHQRARWGRHAPPAVRYEVVRPRPGYFWVNGNYSWRNDQYHWVPGRYEAVQQNRVWVDGRWEMQNGYWVWIDGYWQNQPQQLWIEGRYEWRNGMSVWIPGHYQQTAYYR